MDKRNRQGGARPVGDIANALIDPVLRRKAGMTTALLQSWDEIAGPRLADRCRPERVLWPRRAGEDDPFEPATLVIACEGAAALHVQHETGEIIGKVNAFLGFGAVGRIRIVQKPVNSGRPSRRPILKPTTRQDQQRVAGDVSAVDDEGLRASLEKLGLSVIARRKS